MSPKALLALSMKGGVGKTTTAIGLAKALQRRGHRVAMLDVDIHGSALPRALNLTREPGYEPLIGGQLRPVEYEGMQMFSVGLLFPEDVPNMWDGKMKASAVKQIATSSIAWDEEIEWLVVDTPPTSGDEVQSLLDSLPYIYGAVIITQPNDLSLLGITKSLEMLRETETPICGVLGNMAGYTCPNCSHISNPFDRAALDIESLTAEFGIPYLGSVPFAEEEERIQAMDYLAHGVISRRPAKLKKQTGGITRWLLEKALT